MQGRTFTPQQRKKKKAYNHGKLKNVPLSSKQQTEFSNEGGKSEAKNEQDGPWSVVTRSTPARRQQPKLLPSALETLSLADGFTVDTLAQLCRIFPSIGHISVREPLLHYVAGLEASDLPDTGIALLHQALKQRGESPALHKPAKSSSEESLDKLRQRHDHRIGPAWRASAARSRLLQTLRRVLQSAESGAQARWDCVCLGLGSVSAEITGWKCVSMWQLVIWEDVCRELFKDCRLVFQDPMFNDTDKSFLASIGHEAVDSPGGYDIINNSSPCVVFAPHFPTNYWSRGMRTGAPLFILGNPIADDASLLAKLPTEDIVNQAAHLIEAISSGEVEETKFDARAEAQLLRTDCQARHEMQVLLESWTSLDIQPPDECRESLWETVIWTRKPEETDDDD